MTIVATKSIEQIRSEINDLNAEIGKLINFYNFERISKEEKNRLHKKKNYVKLLKKELQEKEQAMAAEN